MGEDLEETSFIPLVSEEDSEGKFNKIDDNSEIDILPLRNTVLFPGVILPINVGRKSSLKLIRENLDVQLLNANDINPRVSELIKTQAYKEYDADRGYDGWG